jgi:hypothetical protein
LYSCQRIHTIKRNDANGNENAKRRKPTGTDVPNIDEGEAVDEIILQIFGGFVPQPPIRTSATVHFGH